MLSLLFALAQELALSEAPGAELRGRVEGFSKPQVIGNHFSTGPRLPLAGDFDADGYGDLACVYTPGGGIVDVSLSVRGMKMRSHVAPARGFGADVVACAAGEVRDPKGTDIVVLLANGDVRIVHTFAKNAMSTSEAIGRVEQGTRVVVSRRIVVLRPSGKWWVEGRETEGIPKVDAACAGPVGSIYVVANGEVLQAELRGDRWERKAVGRGKRVIWGSFGLLIDPAVPEGELAACDVTGDGADDLLCFQKDGDILLYVRVNGKDSDGDGVSDDEEKRLGTDPLDRDTDRDGLLDGWEVNGYGGFDFAAEGFSPKKVDVLCYVQRHSDVDGAAMAAELKQAEAYYATVGIGFHPRYLEPLAEKHRGRPWWELGGENLPREMWGLGHYMVVGRGGGGQSAQLGTMGGCGDQGLKAVFVHEFGHQLGLGHTGASEPAWCPLYRSLMNYAFTYSGVGYSRGEFAGVTLDERKLSERLPFEYEKLKYLEGHPFRFRLKAEGKETLIDWNRNGRFDSGFVSADINSSYSTDGGHRETVGKASFGPTIAVVGDRYSLISIDPEGNLRSGNTSYGKCAATSDPFAIGFRGRVHLFVPTKDGIGWWVDFSPEGTFPGREVSAFEFRGRLLVLSWTAGETAIYENGREIGKLPMKSEIPPGAVEVEGEIVVGFAVKGGRWKIARLRPDLSIVEERWVGGEKSGWAGNRRCQLFNEEGRIHFIATGMVPENGHACVYDAMTIADPTHDDGWLLKRYYDEWTTTKSPAAAAWYRGDLLLGIRWTNDDIFFARRGLGIQDKPMADFDDVKHMLDYGIARSILWMAPPP